MTTEFDTEEWTGKDLAKLKRGNAPMKTWTVTFGQSTKVFYTRYYAEQFTRALWLNETPYTIKESE